MRDQRPGFCAPFRIFGWRDYWTVYVAALLVLIAGLFTAKQAGTETDLRMRRDLVRQASDIAAAINHHDFDKLSFTAEDKGRPEFQRMSTQLRAYSEASGLTSIYTMALRGGQIVFGPESLPEGHPYASPPGTVYADPSEEDFEIFNTGRAQIQGPVSDEYGTFVTASIPVVDSHTGDVLAVVGVDVEAESWQAAVRHTQWVYGGSALALAAVLLLSVPVFNWRQRRLPKRDQRIVHTETVLCAVLMVLLTVVAALYFDRIERDEYYNAFYEMAHVYTLGCTEKVSDIHYHVEQMKAFFEASREVGVSREEFKIYCKKIVQDEMVQACVWIPDVAVHKVDEFVQTVHHEGLTNYFIWQKNEDRIRVPATVRPMYYPILYVEPQSENARGLGYDLISEPVRSAALEQALRTGMAVATDPIQLGSQTNPIPRIYVFQRVDTPQQKGFTGFIVRPENLLGGNRRFSGRAANFNVCIFQLQCGKEPLLLAGSTDVCGLPCWHDDNSGLRLTVPVFRFDKAYTLRVVPSANWMANHPARAGWITVLAGLLITVLLSWLVTLYANRRRVLEKLVERRTGELKESEARFRSYFELPLIGIAVTSPEKGWIEVNDSLCSLLGYSRQELKTTDWAHLTHPDDVDADLAQFNRVLAGEIENYTLEKRFIRKDGEAVWVNLSVGCVRAGQGKIKYFVAMLQNITDRKLAEENLSRSEGRLSALVHTIPDLVWLKDPEGVYLSCNPMFERFFGAKEADIVGKTDYDFMSRELADFFRGNDQRAAGAGKPTVNEERITFADDGHRALLETIKTPVYDHGGNLIGVLGIGRDITARKQIERTLKESEQRARAIIECSPVPMAVNDIHQNITYLNPAAIRTFGYTLDDIPALADWWSRAYPDPAYRQWVAEEWMRRLDLVKNPDGLFQALEVTIRCKDGTDRIVLASAVELGHSANSDHLVVLFDITESRQAALRIEESFDRLKKIADRVPGMVYQFCLRPDGTSCFPYASEKIREIYRVAPEQVQADASDVFAILHPDDYDEIVSSIQKSAEELTLWRLEYRVKFMDGTIRWLFGEASPVREPDGSTLWHGFITDITERKQVEQQLEINAARIQLATRAGSIGVWDWDVQANELVWDESMYALYGTREVDFSGAYEAWAAAVHGDDRLFVDNEIQAALRGEREYAPEFRIVRPDGSVRIIKASSRTFRDKNGKVVRMVGINIDITERKQAEDRIRQLVQHLETVREEERKRLSRELHDDIGQILTALKIDLMVVQSDCTCKDGVKVRMGNMQKLLSEGVQSVHSLCRRLRPGALDDLGLDEALAGLVDDWQQRNQAICELVVEVDDSALSDAIRTSVFRLVQESLTNVSRYAEASIVKIHLVSDQASLNVSVGDNGRGMEAGAESKPTSFGLLGMRERVEALGGTLHIESAPGKGTRIEASIPLGKAQGWINQSPDIWNN